MISINLKLDSFFSLQCASIAAGNPTTSGCRCQVCHLLGSNRHRRDLRRLHSDAYSQHEHDGGLLHDVLLQQCTQPHHIRSTGWVRWNTSEHFYCILITLATCVCAHVHVTCVFDIYVCAHVYVTCACDMMCKSTCVCDVCRPYRLCYQRIVCCHLCRGKSLNLSPHQSHASAAPDFSNPHHAIPTPQPSESVPPSTSTSSNISSSVTASNAWYIHILETLTQFWSRNNYRINHCKYTRIIIMKKQSLTCNLTLFISDIIKCS